MRHHGLKTGQSTCFGIWPRIIFERNHGFAPNGPRIDHLGTHLCDQCAQILELVGAFLGALFEHILELEGTKRLFDTTKSGRM